MSAAEWDWDRHQRSALSAIDAGIHVAVGGVPGSGKSSVAVQAMRRALAAPPTVGLQNGGAWWAPGLLLTPDRRRAVSMEGMVNAGGPQQLAGLNSNGSHRLVRSLSSYAYMVIGLWLVERDQPAERLPMQSGALEDAWLMQFLHADADADGVDTAGADPRTRAARNTPAFRMEMRNLMALAGQAGLLPQDLVALGRRLGLPLWVLAGQAYGTYSGWDAAFTENTPHLDSARVARVAANLLRRWQTEGPAVGIRCPVPVPRLVIVDDAQDMPVSARELVGAMASAGSQVVVIGSPDQAVAAFRGGVADLAQMIAKDLQAPQVWLPENHRSPEPIRQAVDGVSAWFRHEHRRPDDGSSESSPDTRAGTGDDSGADALFAESSAVGGPSVLEGHADRRGVTGDGARKPVVEVVETHSVQNSRIGAILREAHLYRGIPWRRMAVIARHAGSVEALQDALSRQRVPVQSGERPVVLSRIPVCAALLDLLAPDEGSVHREPRAPLAADVESSGPDEAAALRLVTSPLVGADSLGVFRALRGFRAVTGSDGGISDMLRSLEAEDVTWAHAVPPRVLGCLQVASRLWELRARARSLTPQKALWLLWDTAGLGQPLRELSEGSDWRASQASEDLDAVLALFRKADLWEQQQVDASSPVTASRFALDLRDQSVATDPLVPRGLAESGVSVLTPTQAAGRQWDVVVLADVQEGVWPAQVRPGFGSFSRLERILEQARLNGWRGEEPIGDYVRDPGMLSSSHPGSDAGAKRLDEARLFYEALTRSAKELYVLATENEDSAPSAFLVALEEDGLVSSARAEEMSRHPVLASGDAPQRGDEGAHGNPGDAPAPRQHYLSLEAVAIAMRRTLLDSETADAQKRDAAAVLALLWRRGVDSADPSQWSPGGALSSDSPVLDLGPVRLSPSKLQVAHDCGLRWFLDSVGGAAQDLQEEPTDIRAARLGALVHQIAEENPHGGPEDLVAALHEKWEQWGLPQDTVWQRRALADLEIKLGKLGKYFQSVQGTVLTEQRLSFSIPGAVVSGRADRIEVGSDGSARVVDIKTGDTGAKASVAENAQLTAYQVGIAEMGLVPSGAALLGLKEKRQIVLEQQPMTAEQIEQSKQDLQLLAGRLSGSRLEATPGNDICRNCSFQIVCPAKANSARGVE